MARFELVPETELEAHQAAEGTFLGLVGATPSPAEDEGPPRFVEIDEHTGREVPVLRRGEPPGIVQRIRNYLGIRPPETTPLDIEAMERRVRPFDIRQEVFQTGIVEEYRRVIGRGVSGLTGGVSDLLKGYEENPETWPGAFVGAGAELAGFLVGPFKGAKIITGTRLAPTAKGLRGVAQVMTHGAANLGLASSLASVAPALMHSEDLTDLTFTIAESGAVGGVVGFLFPAMGAIPSKPLRLAVSLAVMDKIRAGPRQWFTADDVLRGLKDGTISASELAHSSFGYLMDIYFTMKVPSMKRQLAELDNRFLQEVARTDVQEVENAILGLAKRGDIRGPAREGIERGDVLRTFGSEKDFGRVADATSRPPAAQETPTVLEGEVLDRIEAIRRTTEDIRSGAEPGRVVVFDPDSLAEGRRRPIGVISGQGKILDLVADVFDEVNAVADVAPGKLIEAIIKDKANPTYQRLKRAVVDQIAEEKGIERHEAPFEAPPAGPPPSEPPPPAAARPPTPPRPAPESARAVEAMFNTADAELSGLRRLDLKTLRQQLARATLDVSAEVKKQLLERGGDLGREAVIRHDLIRGMGAKTERIYSEAEKHIWADLDKVEGKLLDRLIQSRRTIAIDRHRLEVLAQEQERLRTLTPELAKGEQAELVKRAEETIKHPGGLGREPHEAYLKTLRESDPALFAKVNERADRYFATMRQQLTALRDAGLISKETFTRLDAVGDYSPRRFLQHIDPDRRFAFGGKTISVPDSGLKRLDTGSERSLENNSRLLLQEVVARTQRRIARNEANRALLVMAQQVPENGVVRFLGKKGEPPKAEEELISVVIKGKQERLAMPRELARQWVESDPAINAQMANLIGWASGTTVLKAMATGLNPEFALTNMPRDMLHVWLTTHEYSPHLPGFAAQLAKDYAVTAKDAIFRRGAYVDYINEGGGMSFLTHQGRVTPLTGVWGDIQRVLGYIGETSEVWTRLALRNRALTNERQPHEATWVARNYLDFSQGGWAVKGADTAIPYLNASVQATRGLFRAAKERPGETAWKFSQLASVASGLYLANRLINEDAWDSVPAREKVNNFIITTPLQFIDEEGNTRWLYFKVAKDQPQRVVASAFEAMMGKMLGDPVDGDQVAQGFQDFFPIMPTDTMPPALSAMMGYFANKDFWRNEDIWKGPAVAAREEYTRYTHPALREFGQLTGMSPERTRHALTQFFTYGTIYSSAVGAGTAKLMEALGEEQRRQTTLDMVNAVPFLRRVMRATDPFEPFRKEVEDIRLEDQTRRFVIQRDLDALSEQFYRARKAGQETKALDQQVRQFIRTQPADLHENLVQRHVFFGHVFEIPDRRFWLNLHGLSPEARATVFWTRWMQAEAGERKALLERAATLPGILSERFVVQFEKLKRGARRFELLPGGEE